MEGLGVRPMCARPRHPKPAIGPRGLAGQLPPASSLRRPASYWQPPHVRGPMVQDMGPRVLMQGGGLHLVCLA